MTNLFKILKCSINKDNMNQILDDFQQELGRVMLARNALDVPSKGQAKGYYLSTYKQGFEIMKPLTSLKYDARVSGREELKKNYSQSTATF